MNNASCISRSLLCLAVVFAACSPPDGSRDTVRVERQLALMGTTLAVTVEAVDRPTALAASERAVRALEATEARLSTWRDDTELTRFNRTPAGVPVILSPRLSADLMAAYRWWKETGGAFDPGIGTLIEAWGLRRGGQIPDADTRRIALACGGLSSLRLTGRTAIRLHPGLKIEEGGFGKGAGLDEALAAMAGNGVAGGMIDLGGQVAVTGSVKPAMLSIAHPDHREQGMIDVAIDRGSVATSGNSERGFVIDGVRYGHILDPRTGRPAPDFGSLTVWAPDALTADCLSTGLYVLGPERALAWASQHPGIEALVLEPTANGLCARATPGWKSATTRIAAGVTMAYAR